MTIFTTTIIQHNIHIHKTSIHTLYNKLLYVQLKKFYLNLQIMFKQKENEAKKQEH